jgi:fatty acid desaturase
MAVMTLEWSWGAYLAAIYVVGATANHSLFLAIHELSHNLGFKSVAYNKMLAMVANLPIGIPYCITFKPYHMEHHRYQVTRSISRLICLMAWDTEAHACTRWSVINTPAAVRCEACHTLVRGRMTHYVQSSI